MHTILLILYIWLLITFIFFQGIGGYVQCVFAKTFSRYQNMSYGVGAITDGLHKLTVQISNFTKHEIEKRAYVVVTGSVDNKSEIILKHMLLLLLFDILNNILKWFFKKK